jgi:hypothetical protein
MAVLTKTSYGHSPAMIPFLTKLVNGILETTQEQLRYLEKAKDDASALDDVVIQSILELYEEQIIYLALLREQCLCWRYEPLTDRQFQAVRQLEIKISTLERVGQQISFLANHYQLHTADKILAMSPEKLLMTILRVLWENQNQQNYLI